MCCNRNLRENYGQLSFGRFELECGFDFPLYTLY